MLEGIIFIIYMVWGWKAANEVWYSKRVYLVTDSGKFYVGKLIMVMLLGWLFILISLFSSLFKR